MAKEAAEVEIVSISPLNELRFILNVNDSVTIELTNGEAFSYGWKLPLHVLLNFRDQPFPISTKQGCSIKVSGTFVSYYSAPFVECPIIEDIKISETVFVVGAPSSGKTSLCKCICNSLLNTSQSRYRIYVNADPDQSPFCPPGCIGAIPVTSPINNFGFPFTDPIIYMYGTTKVEEKKGILFSDQLKELLNHIAERRKFVGSSDGGTVIDFPSITSKFTYEMLEKAITNLVEGTTKNLGPIRIIVVGNDKLYTNIRRSMPGIPADKIPILPGAINLSKEARAAIRNNEIRRYFYGDGNPDLIPQTYFLSKGNVQLYSFGSWSVLNEAMMPIMIEIPDPKVVQPVPFSDRLVGIILAVLPQENRSLLWKQTVFGFMHVLEYKEDEKQLTVLKPNSDALPSNTIIVSQVKCNPQ